MRLWIEVNGVHYYDVGLRNFDGNQNLSKEIIMFGSKQPRFLEDFIEKYDAKNIRIREFGSLKWRNDWWKIYQYISGLGVKIL